MKFKVGDIVLFKDSQQEGVGRIKITDERYPNPYLVYSKDVDNLYWWFKEEHLRYVGENDVENPKNELIKELTEIYNELTEIPELKHVYGSSMKVVTKALIYLLNKE